MATLDEEIYAGATLGVSGAGNTGIVVGRDFVVRETHVHGGAEEFVPYDLDSIPPDEAPRATDELAARLRRDRLLVLAGDCEDKPLVARHVAARVARGAAVPLAVLEWSGGPDLDSLLRGLRRQAAPAVVMLLRAEPRQVDWRPGGLGHEARRLGHHVVATTDLPRAVWRLGAGDQAFWHELAEDDLFDTPRLVSALIDELARVEERLLAGVLVEADVPDLSTVGGVSLRELAGRLRTPGNAAVFVSLLVQRAARGGVDSAAVRQLLAEVTSPRRRVERWFGAADPAQLLALGLSLFEGLPDDQFFAALERWVDHIRAHRDPRQRAFDYGDVAPLEGFFRRVVTDGGGMRFEPRWPGQRRWVFEAAWQSHRRQLLNALAVLTDLAAASPEGRGNDGELYGTAGRRRRLRTAVTEALSDVGLLSAGAVEPALLRLASDDDPDVQEVAASAAARWRRSGRDAQFFALLGRWQRDARIRGLVEALLTGRDEKRNRDSHAQIRSTIALAVGEASGYDPPNQLAPELVALLRQLAADGNGLVRDRFARYTLPRVVGLHLAQLRGPLRELARYVGLTHAIGAALAAASLTLPGEVLATLDEWHQECARTRPAAVDPRRITPRDALAMVVAFAYGELPYDEGGPLTAEAGFARLREVLAGEAHPRVRSAAVIAVGRQARRRFDSVEEELRKLVGLVTADEQDEVVRLLTGVYLDQRRRLPGGDGEVEVDGKRYPIWVDRARPITDVELAMLRWLADAAYPVAQRMAVQAALAFVETLDRAEGGEIARRRDERLRRQAADAAARIAGAPLRFTAEPGWYTGRLVPWLATLSAPHLLPVVRGILPEALAQRSARPATLEYVLGRWEGMRGGDETPEIARYVRGALAWHAGAGWLIGFGGLFLLFVLVAVF